MARLAHGGGGCVCAHGPSSNHLSVNLCSFSHFSLWERSVERWRVECRVCCPCAVRCCLLKRCDGGKGPVQSRPVQPRWCSRARLSARALG